MKDSYVFYKDRLRGEYLSSFEQVEMYVLTQSFDEAAYEERLSQLLDVFLTAQESGRPVEKITGGDIRQFCRTFCSDLGIKNRLLSFVDYVNRIMCLLFVFSAADLLFLLFRNDGAPLSILSSYSDLNVSGLIIGGAAAGIVTAAVGALIRHLMFRRKNVSMKVLKTVPAVVAVSTFLIILLAMLMTRTELFRVRSWIVAAVTAPLIVAYYIFRGRHIKRERVKMSDIVAESVSVSMAETMWKMYLKKKKRREKRGERYPITEFLDYEERDCRMTEKISFIYFVLPLIFTFAEIMNLRDSPSLIERIVHPLILLAVEYALMMWLWRISKNSVRERRAWIAEKRAALESGEIDEYGIAVPDANEEETSEDEGN